MFRRRLRFVEVNHLHSVRLEPKTEVLLLSVAGSSQRSAEGLTSAGHQTLREFKRLHKTCLFGVAETAEQ